MESDEPPATSAVEQRRREIDREKPRTLRLDRARPGFEPRPSRSDENAITDQVRQRERDEATEQAREREAELERRVAHALRAIEHVRELGVDWDDFKDVDHHCRRLL